MIEYAREITETFSRCQIRQADIETGIVDYVQMKSEIRANRIHHWQDAESELHFTKVEKIRSDIW